MQSSHCAERKVDIRLPFEGINLASRGGGAWGFSIESGMHAQVSAIQSRFRHAIPLSRCSFRSIVESENDYHFSSSFFENV